MRVKAEHRQETRSQSDAHRTAVKKPRAPALQVQSVENHRRVRLNPRGEPLLPNGITWRETVLALAAGGAHVAQAITGVKRPPGAAKASRRASRDQNQGLMQLMRGGGGSVRALRDAHMRRGLLELMVLDLAAVLCTDLCCRLEQGTAQITPTCPRGDLGRLRCVLLGVVLMANDMISVPGAQPRAFRSPLTMPLCTATHHHCHPLLATLFLICGAQHSPDHPCCIRLTAAMCRADAGACQLLRAADQLPPHRAQARRGRARLHNASPAARDEQERGREDAHEGAQKDPRAPHRGRQRGRGPPPAGACGADKRAPLAALVVCASHVLAMQLASWLRA